MSKLKATVYPTVGSGILLGSITGIVKNHILSKLPKGYIKYTYIKNSVASVTEQAMGEEAAIVKEKPALSLGLNYSYNDAVGFGDTYRWGMSRIPVGAHQYDRIYTKILMCEKDNVYVSTIDERVKLVFDVAVRLDSESQAYNLLQYMTSYVGVKRPYYLQGIDVEVPLPFECVNLVAAAGPFDRRTPEGRAAFHEYLRKWSGGRITFKKNLSSGNFNYFMKYNCNVLCQIPDVPAIERTLEGKAVTEGIVRYTLEAEFPTFTNFITEHEELDLSSTPTFEEGLQPGAQGDSAIYNFTSRFHFGRQEGDKSIALMFEYVTGVNSAIDETPFKEALSPSLSFFVDHQSRFLPEDEGAISRHLQVVMVRDNDRLQEGADYEVDWTTCTVRLINPLYNYVYRLALYVDLAKYNEVLEVHNSLSLRQADPVKKVAEVKDVI